MSALTPEKRMNVKGHLVTKHVRTGPKASAGAAKIPQPKIQGGKKAEVLDPLSQPVGIKYFHAAESDKAFYRKFANMIGGDPVMPAEAQITSRVWYAAQRLNLNHIAIFTMAALGYEDADEMAAHVDSLDRRSGRKETPGREMRRHRWVDNLVSEGISYATVQEACKNYDGLRLDRLSTPDADKATAADIVRAYAEFAGGKSRTAVLPLIWEGELTYDQVKEYSATRVSRHEDTLRRFVTDKPGKMPLDDFMEIAKKEEKGFSPLSKDLTSRVARRAEAAILFGKDRAMELRLLDYDVLNAVEKMDDKENAFRFAQFHDEVQHQSIMRGSHSSPSCNTYGTCDNFSKSKDYAAVTASKFYKPSPEATMAYFELGLSAEDTIAALEDGKEAYVIRAKNEGGIQEALADGWL